MSPSRLRSYCINSHNAYSLWLKNETTSYCYIIMQVSIEPLCIDETKTTCQASISSPWALVAKLPKVRTHLPTTSTTTIDHASPCHPTSRFEPTWWTAHEVGAMNKDIHWLLTSHLSNETRTDLEKYHLAILGPYQLLGSKYWNSAGT